MHRVFCIFCLATFLGMTIGSGTLHAESHAGAFSKPVWILGNGFHSAVALRIADAGPFLRKAARDRNANWVMVGWGDRDFFMAKRVTPWITIKAVCWPTPSALHVIPLRKPPEALYRNSDIVRIDLDAMHFTQLRNYLEAQFATDQHGNPVFLGDGFSDRSAFYLGVEKFYFPKMCNLWVTRGLQRAGLRMSILRGITAHELLRQVRKYGKRTGVRRLPVDGF